MHLQLGALMGVAALSLGVAAQRGGPPQEIEPKVVEVDKYVRKALDGLAPESAQLVALQNTAAKHRLTIEMIDYAYALADRRGGYGKYSSGLSGNFRRKLKQKGRKIDAAGGAVVGGIQLSVGADAMDDCIARMIAINEASYKLEGRRLADNHREYLAELVQRFGPRGMLSLPILSIAGQAAAFILGVVERGCFYDITLAYAESFAKLSPGILLMQKTMETPAAAGVHTVVSHGAHDYKKHWATAFVPQKRVFLFAPGVRAAATVFIRFSMAPPWRRLGQTEPED